MIYDRHDFLEPYVGGTSVFIIDSQRFHNQLRASSSSIDYRRPVMASEIFKDPQRVKLLNLLSNYSKLGMVSP